MKFFCFLLVFIKITILSSISFITNFGFTNIKTKPTYLKQEPTKKICFPGCNILKILRKIYIQIKTSFFYFLFYFKVI